MNCPKCGFSQPDDIYCAMCGVHVEKYTLRKKKKRLKRSIFVLVLGAGTLVVWGYLGGFTHWSSERLPEERNRVIAPLSQSDSTRKGKIRTTSSSWDGGKRGREKDDFEKPNLSSKRSDQRAPGTDENRTDTTFTPQDWFQRGIALDDDSESEIEYYQKALDLDPNFAPALFRLGAIYYRQARYENADEVFSKFLNHATEEDKRLYDIYVYYSLSDVDRLLERLKPADSESGTNTEKKDSLGDEQSETPWETEQETQEGTEGINTIVRFSAANGHVTVPVVLNDTLTTTMLVDTGAGITVLSRELADVLQLEFERNRSITLKTMAMDVEAQLARLETIQVGELKKKGLLVAVTDIPIVESGAFTAILGMDFLQNYVLQIDNQNHTFTLTSKNPNL